MVSLGSPASIAKGGAMAETRRLYRSKSRRVLAGVCGGLAQYFNLDATLIRVLFVLLAVLGGSGLVLYVAMWIIVPNQPCGRSSSWLVDSGADPSSRGLGCGVRWGRAAPVS
jgi:phage shock protein C